MARLALDTNAISAVLKNDQSAIHCIDSFDGQIVIPMTVYGEVVNGFLGGNRYDTNMNEFKKMMQALHIKLLEIDTQVCQNYAEIFQKLKKEGTPIPVNDAWIAASCLRHNCILMTKDSDFNNVSKLELRNW